MNTSNSNSNSELICYEDMFYTEDDNTKLLLKEVSSLHEAIYYQATDIKDIMIEENIRFCMLMIRLAHVVINKKITTKQKLYWKFDGKWNPSLFHIITVNVIDTANIYIGQVSYNEKFNSMELTDEKREVRHVQCREIVGLLNWILKNVYKKGASVVAEERDYGSNRATEMKKWCQAYALWNGMKRMVIKYELSEDVKTSTVAANPLDLKVAIQMGRTCMCLLRSIKQPNITLKMKGKYFITTVVNGCLGQLIVNDHDNSHKPISEKEEMLKKCKWSEAAFTEYILIAAKQKDAVGEIGDTIALLQLAYLNNRHVKDLTEKRKNNAVWLNKYIRSPVDAVELLNNYYVLEDEDCMPNGHNPLEASDFIDNDITEFIF